MIETKGWRVALAWALSALAASRAFPQDAAPTPKPSPEVSVRSNPEVVKALPTAGSLTARAVPVSYTHLTLPTKRIV